MTVTIESDGFLIRMDSSAQVAHIVQAYPSGSWGQVETVPLATLIAYGKTLLARSTPEAPHG